LAGNQRTIWGLPEILGSSLCKSPEFLQGQFTLWRVFTCHIVSRTDPHAPNGDFPNTIAAGQKKDEKADRKLSAKQLNNKMHRSNETLLKNY
jgi:hypothetical protein